MKTKMNSINFKEYLGLIDWKKFWKVEIWCIVIVTLFYLLSLVKCKGNVFPENLWSIPVISILFMILLFVKSFIEYLERLMKKSNENF
jgi:hypothetical protein